MSEEKPRKKIGIVGTGDTPRVMKAILEEMTDFDVEIISFDELNERRAQNKQIEENRFVVLEDLYNQKDVSKAMTKLVSASRAECFSADEREFYASRRYQKPPRIHGTAQHKRQAKKARKGKRK